MASIHKEIGIAVSPEIAWDAVRDLGAVHTRLAPGLVTGTQLLEGARIVTFVNGLVLHETIVDVDENSRRLVWSASGGAMTHHNASLQIFADGEQCRAVWIADLLPNEIAPTVAEIMEQGLGAMRRTLEGS